MSSGRLRVAFVSGVRHAAPYIERLRQDPRVDIVGLAEEPEASEWMRKDSERTAARSEIPLFDDPGSILDPERVDLAVICSEPTRHARLAIQALASGVHVLVDKPVATTLQDADAVADAVTSAAGSCSVINRTHAPALRRTRSWVDAGYLGLPRHIDVEFLANGTHFATSVERPELVIDPTLSGGGELLNFLGYCTDAIRYLTGLEIRSVYAMSGSLFEAGHARYGVEDTAIVSLGLDHGVTSTVTVGRIPYAPGLGSASTSLRLIGSHGHAVADDGKPAVLRYGGGSTVSALPLAGGRPNETLGFFLRHVVDSLLSGEAPDYGIAEARASMAAIDAAYRSIETGTVAVPL